MSMQRTVFGIFAVIVAVAAGAQPARAQSPDPWTAAKLVQADLSADRQALVAANLPLSDVEARAFWPVYREYRADVDKIGDRVIALIAAYGASFDAMTEAKADAFLADSRAIERDRLDVREKYAPRVRAVLPGQKAARFFQIEHKLDAIVSVTVSSEIPLVPVNK